VSKISDAMAFLEALGLSDELESFTGRKRVQKIFYLLKQFGADLKFGYTWYLHGPYSPELTRALLDSPDTGTPQRSLTKEELESVNSMRNFMADDFYSVDKLELIVSLIYLIKYAPEQGYDSKKKIFDFIREQKPQFSKNDVETAWRKVERSKIWDDYLDKLVG